MKKTILILALILAGCAGPQKGGNGGPHFYGYSAGKCWNWDSIEKQVKKHGECGKTIVFRDEVYECSRDKKHGGWCHGHIFDNCVILF